MSSAVKREKANDEYQKTLQFMTDTYGLNEEMLRGIDIVRFAEDYELFSRDYTREEVEEILEDEKDNYVPDDTQKVFDILNQTEGGRLEEDAVICRIGYYRHSGTLLQRMIYDLENKVFYADDAAEHPLTQEQVQQLQGIPGQCGISAWENYYEGEEKESTGSFRWKLAFEYEDGTICVFGGYTGDGTHLPENFSAVDEMLMKIIKEK